MLIKAKYFPVNRIIDPINVKLLRRIDTVFTIAVVLGPPVDAQNVTGREPSQTVLRRLSAGTEGLPRFIGPVYMKP